MNIPLGNFQENRSVDQKRYNIVWNSFVKYIKNLTWEPISENMRGVTFLELVVDFELVSGLEIRDFRSGRHTMWGRKATSFAAMYRILCRCYPQFDGPLVAKKVRSLFPFAGAAYAGLDRRPALLGKQGTELAIAANCIDFIKNREFTPNIRISFGHMLSYTGIVNNIILKDPDFQKLRDYISNMTQQAPPPQAPAAPAPRAGSAVAERTRRRLVGKQRPRCGGPSVEAVSAEQQPNQVGGPSFEAVSAPGSSKDALQAPRVSSVEAERAATGSYQVSISETPDTGGAASSFDLAAP